MIKRLLKSVLSYAPLTETGNVRSMITTRRRIGLPFCPPDEGDLLFSLAQVNAGGSCLEIGFGTGSTALYMLLGACTGRVTSIDYRQAEDFNNYGIEMIASSGMGDRHTLVGKNSNAALPALLEGGQEFALIFLDGWKTFDHLWVDVYYCNQMLRVGGYMVFDDTRMPAVKKAIRLLVANYEYEEVDAYAIVGGVRLRLWHIPTTRSLSQPYRVFRKRREYSEVRASQDYTYWKRF